MKISRAITLMSVTVLAHVTHAGEQTYECCDDLLFDPIITLSGGIAFNTDAGASQDFSVGYSQLDYDAHHETNVRGVWGGFLGAEFPVLPLWALQLGVAYYQSSTYGAEGTLAQGYNPNSTADYDYNYEIIARQILFEGKFSREILEIYRPYFSLGLGVGINDAKNYTIDYPPTLAMTPLYDNHTTTAFSYNIGVGLDIDMTDYLRLGLGYRFTDFGKVKLGEGVYDPFEPTPIPETLEQNHLYIQELLFQLTLVM